MRICNDYPDLFQRFVNDRIINFFVITLSLLLLVFVVRCIIVIIIIIFNPCN